MIVNRTTAWQVAGLVVAGLAIAMALAPRHSNAQLEDPPLGWNDWEPDQTVRKLQHRDRVDPSYRWQLTRHDAFAKDGVPVPYRDATNPLAQTPNTVRAGASLYEANCATCHDPKGTGHGESGLALYPSPALLADKVRMPAAADGYLMWSIAEGGRPFGTQMPAFKETFTEDQIWAIVAFMRAGFPEEAGAE